MERLTLWYDGYHGICEKTGCANNNTENCALAVDEDACSALQEIIDHLASYEDTGLEPEEIKLMQEWWRQVPMIVKDQVKRICGGEFTREAAEDALEEKK